MGHNPRRQANFPPPAEKASVRAAVVEVSAPMTSRWLVLVAPLALVASLAGACTTHGVGGRCDKQNTTTSGNLDCDPGLVCTSGSDLLLPGDSGARSQSDICCPSDRTTADPFTICALAPPTPGSDASIPDTGTDGTVTDATTDQSSGDAAGDAADAAISDASTDAP
ncbi:MAG: hypothetical protein LUO89_14550, partial [Methanothrix sp.]|nr:hypothetical protein [Methanothrix sp.]